MPRSVSEIHNQRRRSRSMDSSRRYNRERSGNNRQDSYRSPRHRRSTTRTSREPSKLPSLLKDIDLCRRPRVSKDKVRVNNNEINRCGHSFSEL